jgi:D-amino peptidase
MAEDANAAIRGAFEGGATDVLVNDSHGSQRNLLPEDLDPRARLISHTFKRHGMMEGLDETFDAIIFVGYHAKADAPRGSSRTPARVSCAICRSTAARSARAA